MLDIIKYGIIVYVDQTGRKNMKNYIILSLVALTINSAQAGGVYRYHSKHAVALSLKQKNKFNSQTAKNRLNHELFKQDYQIKKMRARRQRTQKYRNYVNEFQQARSNYERSDLELLQAEKEVWESGINVDMVHRPDLNPGKYTNIRKVR